VFLRSGLCGILHRYFQDSDKGSDLVEEQTFADVINNHDHASRYAYEDLDGIPFPAYGSDA
jgi:hypothetical protein